MIGGTDQQLVDLKHGILRTPQVKIREAESVTPVLHRKGQQHQRKKAGELGFLAVAREIQSLSLVDAEDA